MRRIDLTRPLHSVLRSVEADVLEALLSSHLSRTGSELARMCSRSKSQVWTVLRALHGHGVVTRMDDEGGSWWSLNPHSPVARALRDAAHIPTAIVTFLRDEFEQWPQPPTAAAIAPASWAAAFHHDSLVVAVLAAAQPEHVQRTHRAVTRALGTSTLFLAGTRAELRELLGERDIVPWHDAEQARTIVGHGIGWVLGGTGGI